MRAPLWVTIVAGALALVLIVYGVVLLGSILQGSGSLRVDTSSTGGAALNTDVLAAPTPQPLLAGIESGSMPLGAQPQEPEVVVLAAAEALPADVPAPTEAAPPTEVPPPAAPSPTADPCLPQAEGGFAADTPLAAIGMIRLYIEPDVLAPTLGEFSAGQTFLVTADTAGVTALRRCELVWVRVRLTGGGMGWALANALQTAPATIEPLIAPTASPPICPGGCATPTCVPPCAVAPCNSPCTQPCTTPCGVYSQ